MDSAFSSAALLFACALWIEATTGDSVSKSGPRRHALLLATVLPLVTLASLTSAVTLLVFAAVNVALVRIKRQTAAPERVVTFPVWVPVCGAALSVGLLLLQLLGRL